MGKRDKHKLAITTTKKRLSNALAKSTEKASQLIRREFIDKFTLCDVTCKSILEFYAKAKGKYVPGSFIELSMKKIPYAMNHFGFTIPQHILNGIFGGSGPYKKRGTKSAKKLRDGIVHGMNIEDINEVVHRYEDLTNLMDNFLAYFI